MHFFYDIAPKKFDGSFDMSDVDPSFMFLKHFDNYLLLQLIVKNDPSLPNRFQATSEFPFCESKMEFWSCRSGFNFDFVMEEMRKRKKLWKLEKEVTYLPVLKSGIKKMKKPRRGIGG